MRSAWSGCRNRSYLLASLFPGKHGGASVLTASHLGGQVRLVGLQLKLIEFLALSVKAHHKVIIHNLLEGDGPEMRLLHTIKTKRMIALRLHRLREFVLHKVDWGRLVRLNVLCLVSLVRFRVRFKVTSVLFSSLNCSCQNRLL